MLAKVNSAALYGIDALRVEVEIDLASGLPQLATVGLPEGAVKESKDRIRAAVKNCGYTFPAKRITINLAPADIQKEGSAYDLPMAVGILAAEGLIQKNLLDDYFLIGELSLDGSVKPVRGALPIAMARPPPCVSLVFAFTASSMPSRLSIMTTFTPEAPVPFSGSG